MQTIIFALLMSLREILGVLLDSPVMEMALVVVFLVQQGTLTQVLPVIQVTQGNMASAVLHVRSLLGQHANQERQTLRSVALEHLFVLKQITPRLEERRQVINVSVRVALLAQARKASAHPALLAAQLPPPVVQHH